jgi:DNA repair protein RadD
MQLRTYQRGAIDALYAWWGDGGGNALIDLATGTGKSLVAAALCKELLERWPGLRIGIVTHVRELIQQNAQELLRLWPQAPIGIYSAGLKRRDARAQIIFCGIQSVHNKSQLLGDIDLLIIDECHLLPRSSDTMYGRFIAACRERISDMRIVGLTATPYRLDSGRLDQGENALFERTIYSYGIGAGVKDEHLAPLINKHGAHTIDLSGAKVRGGEYVAGSIEAAAMDQDTVSGAVSDIVQRGAHRRAWLVFCISVRHAHVVADAIRAHGIACEVVSGETPSGHRDRIITAYKRGEIRCLCNVNVLTTGFNVPQVDLLAWLRPTLSRGLYIQGMGRATRTASGKTNALVLDYAGNIQRHGPVDMDEASSGPAKGSGGKPQQPPVKVCPECQSYVHASAARCQDCGHAFPMRAAPKHDVTTDDSVPVMTTMPPQWVMCSAIACKVHNAEREDKLPSLQVDYLCGMTWHKEWLCFDHEGYAATKAHKLWIELGGGPPAPASVENAYQRRFELQAPTEILIKPDGRFWRVLARRMAKREAA